MGWRKVVQYGLSVTHLTDCDSCVDKAYQFVITASLFTYRNRICSIAEEPLGCLTKRIGYSKVHVRFVGTRAL